VSVGIVALTVATVAIWRLWPRERLLLEHAVRVTNMDGWDRAYRDYMWASDHEAILYSITPDDQVRLVSHNTLTGMEKPLIGLAQRLEERQGKYNGYWLSPDGNWMLYSNFYMASVSATPRDGARRLTWRSKLWNDPQLPRKPTLAEYLGWTGIHWLPDSRRWIQPGSDSSGREATRLMVRSIDTPKEDGVIAIPKSCRSLFEGENSEAMVWLSEAHLVLQTWTVEPGEESTAHSVDFYEADLKKDVPPRHWTVEVPREWTIEKVLVAPHADNVGWVFHRHYVSPLLTELHRLGLPIRLTPAEETMVYVSRADGTEMREIGTTSTPQDANQDVEIKWLPGGKRLSFVYKNMLYTVSAF